MDQSDYNATSHLPQDNDERTDQRDQPSKRNSLRDTQFGDNDSNIKLHPVNQQLPDDAAEAAAILQPPAEDQYMQYVITAKDTLKEVRATLNQSENPDSEELRTYLPILEAAKKNLSNAPSKLTRKTLDDGKRVLNLVELIHSAIKQLDKIITIRFRFVYGKNGKARWITEEYIQMVKENYENICVARELVENHFAEETYLVVLKEIFMDEIVVWECTDELYELNLTEEEEPSTPPASTVAAGGDHSTASLSAQEAKKRKLNYLTAHSSDMSKRFCSGDTDADL